MTTADSPVGSRVFLDHFPQAQRSTVMNDFLIAVRNGAPDIAAVLRHAVAKNDERRCEARRYGDPEGIAKSERFLSLMEAYFDDAYALAEHALWRERLPRVDRERLHAEGAAEGKRLRADSLPPTARQLAYLRDLGDTEPPPTTLAEASDRITRLREQRYGRS